VVGWGALSWWDPLVHDLALLRAVDKHGIGQFEKQLEDVEFRSVWLSGESRCLLFCGETAELS